MATIFTFPGTFTQVSEGETRQWWETGSEFEKELRNYVSAHDGELRFQPVWWGIRDHPKRVENSERARRLGAKALLAQIKLLPPNDKYVLVGHSHGGAIIAEALFSNISRTRHLARAITIGTPFYRATANPGLLFIGGRSSQLAVVAALCSLFLMSSVVSVIYPYDEASSLGHSLWYFMLRTAALAPVYILLVALSVRVAAKILSVLRRIPRASEFDLLLNTRFVTLFDKNDEAVHGLQVLFKINPRLFDQRFARPFFYILSLLLLLMGAVILSGVMAKPYLEIAQMTVLRLGQSFEPFLVSFILSIITPVVLLPFIFIFAVSVPILTLPLGWAFGRLLDRISWNAVKKLALGLDEPGETVTGVYPYPVFVRRPLPDTLSSEINAFSNAEFGKSIPRLRTAVSELIFLAGVDNPEKIIAKYFSWNELIHTSYFAVPRFRKLLYYLIAKSDGFAPTANFLADPDYEVMGGWLSELEGVYRDELAVRPHQHYLGVRSALGR
jgi:hypothetical protein